MSIASSRPPDQGRVPYLQQLAQRGDRRLLLGSVAFAAIGLVLAVLATLVWLAGRYEASQVQTRLERAEQQRRQTVDR